LFYHELKTVITCKVEDLAAADEAWSDW
jgi:hypothetical protein